MDTIQVSIKLNENNIKKLTHENIQEIRRFINGIKNLEGYHYCKFLELSSVNNIVVKISYPRFFEHVNAYLISDSQECLRVQDHFSLRISNHPLLYGSVIYLNRVDIPFTFIMGPNYDFNSYKKVYQVFNYVYKRKNRRASPKAFMDIEEFKVETLTYADTPGISANNSKIMIYDQYKNIETKTRDREALNNLETEYGDLSRRMRIEVSKRIKRKGFTVEEFSQFDIFGEYFVKHKNYLLENILDLNEVDNFYNEKAIDLANRLLEYKEGSNFFTYENFIYREIEHIYDYEIIRRALKICIDNINTRENAITTIRKVLKDYQLNENIIVMETYKNIIEIRKAIELYFRG